MFDRIRLIDHGLHWANLGLLFTTALLPFPTVVISDAIQRGNAGRRGTAVGLYALIGALLCVSWLVFFRYLSHHPSLTEDPPPRSSSRASPPAPSPESPSTPLLACSDTSSPRRSLR